MRFRTFLASAAAAVMLVMAGAQPVSAQTNFGGLSFGGFQLNSLNATSFTSLDGTVTIDVTNPSRKIVLDNVSGIIYKGGIPFIIGTAEEITIPAGTSQVIVNGHASLESMSSMFAILSNPTLDPAAYTFDVKADLKTRGRTRTISYKGLPLSSILKKL